VSKLEVVAIPNGQFAENCYLVADGGSGEAVIIDPGEESARFLAELRQRAWTLSGIWLTHGHIDHIMGVGAVQAATGAPIYLHPKDRALYDDLPNYGAWIGMHVDPPPAPQFDLVPGQAVRVGASAFWGMGGSSVETCCSTGP
jgi:glyoxylase-like metal-dependent hydrolase (beta-lactamase superfamily II)